jgi:transposase
MINEKDFIVMHELYKKGYSIRQIATLLKMDRKTVSKRLAQKELVTIKRDSGPSKLDEYKEFLSKRIKDVDGRIPSSVLLREIQELGYTGRLRILQDFLQSEYEERVTTDPVVRFETEPGLQCQVDWTFMRSGSKPIYAFVATLGYSRMSFVYFTEDMDTSTFIKCHELAFGYFNGIAAHILYDNLKSVVIERNVYGKGLHKFNAEFLDFAQSRGFTPRLCKPYRPQTKGKVERFNSYLKANFYRPLLGKLKDSGIEINAALMNSYINPWLSIANDRVHGTTKERPFARLPLEISKMLPCHQTSAISTKTLATTRSKVQAIPELLIEQHRVMLYEQLLNGSVQ